MSVTVLYRRFALIALLIGIAGIYAANVSQPSLHTGKFQDRLYPDPVYTDCNGMKSCEADRILAFADVG